MNQTIPALKKAGSTLVLAIVMLSISSLIIGSVVGLTTQYSNDLKRSIARERALFLADSGIRYAFSQLKAGKDYVVSFEESQALFSDTSAYDGADWGFSSYPLINVAGKTNRLVVVGKYADLKQCIEIRCSDTAEGSQVTSIFKKAVYEGDPGSTLTFYNDDFIDGPVHAEGNIAANGSNLPYSEKDDTSDLSLDEGEGWQEAGTLQTFSGPLSLEEYNAYIDSVDSYESHFNVNGTYDPGEAFIDSEGNGVYDPGEPFTDSDGDGIYDGGDSYIDRNNNGRYDEGTDTVVDKGNGRYDAGESFTDGSGLRDNGQYDPAGGYYDSDGRWQEEYTTTERVLKKWGPWSWYVNETVTKSCADWPAEQFEDLGDGTYQPGESFVDIGNGYWDEGELFYDDRNGEYDIGTTARGSIYGMDDPAPGELEATGNNKSIKPSDLASMYYHIHRDEAAPTGAFQEWGHDVAVTSSDFDGYLLKDTSKPEHIFIRNPPTSGSTREDNETVYGRSYTPIYYTDKEGKRLRDSRGNYIRVDDYFLEDPTDSTYNSYDSSKSIDGTVNTAPMYLDVKENGNEKVYYVEGNVYIHSPRAYSMRFREPGTKITIVAKGNITISDEFYYNADYPEDINRTGMNSSVVEDAQDGLCLIALKNPNLFNAPSGNIYIGDRQFGTGGSIHSMLYAENNFVDNNVSTSGQPFISIYGNMAAGNQVAINRNESTRLDVTMDRRVNDSTLYLPGLPPPMTGDATTVAAKSESWEKVPGSWKMVLYRDLDF